MRFSEAFGLMKQGALIKLLSWAGYWYWSKENLAEDWYIE